LAIALACAISSSTLAGEVHSTDAPAPQASSSVVTTVILTIISLVAG
jgi:hypothetical protein